MQFNPWIGKIPGEGMVTHSSIHAWRIPWTEEPGGLLSTELQRVRHDWSNRHKWRDLVRTHHILLSIHPLMGHMIVSIIIVTNITIHVYLFKSLPIILLNIYSPRTGTAGSYDGNSLTFWETAKSLSTVPAPSSFSNAGLQFLHTTTTICNSSHHPSPCLDKGHPNPNVTFTGFLKILC